MLELTQLESIYKIENYIYNTRVISCLCHVLKYVLNIEKSWYKIRYSKKVPLKLS